MRKVSDAVYSVAARRVEDPHHPRGYRIVCNKPELRRRKHKLLAEGPFNCVHCGQDVHYLKDSSMPSEYADIELCHREPKGMGGAKTDDDWSNIGLGHKVCNRENGSKRVA